jgi:hypothetical protein
MLVQRPVLPRVPVELTYSCMPKAEPKTANNMVVLLRRTALQRWSVSDPIGRGVRAKGGVLVDVAEHLDGAVSTCGPCASFN